MTSWIDTSRQALGVGLWAGLAGGAAEVAWIAIFSQVTGGSAAHVAVGIAQTVSPAIAGGGAAIVAGLLIHFGLAVLLGLAVAMAVRGMFPSLAQGWAGAGLVVAALAGVWALNFLVILPAVNPAFVHIVPLGASFASKLLFGVAAALVMRAGSLRRNN